MATNDFSRTTKNGYPIIYRGTKAPVAFRPEHEQHYVVAHGYDPDTGEWSQGTYTDNLQIAMADANGEEAPQWDPDQDLLREAAEKLVFTGSTFNAYERYRIAAIMWYVERYLEDLPEIADMLRRECEISWDSLPDRERVSLLAFIAAHHVDADWALVSEHGDFERRCGSCILDDVVDDPRFALDVLKDN